jgi:5'-deoxynucleotidase YfbR-like HD superfamily hydrolase
MPKGDPNLPLLQQLLIDMSLIDRNHYLAKTNRRENDIEHSMTVATLCWYIHEKYSLPLDLSKILKYALAHDFVERYAGDVNTFASEQERAKKIEDEQASLSRLSQEFQGFPDLVTTMEEYESRNDEESLFVWTVDKMQALIMGGLDDWRPYAELGITYDQFVAKYAELLSRSSPHCRDLFETIINDSKTTYRVVIPR